MCVRVRKRDRKKGVCVRVREREREREMARKVSVCGNAKERYDRKVCVIDKKREKKCSGSP